jgi:hypothetical protein
MSDFRERILAATRIEFLNCISNTDFQIEHKVNVHDRMGVGGAIDYNDESEEVKIKSAKLTKKIDKDGGHKYALKIIIE